MSDNYLPIAEAFESYLRELDNEMSHYEREVEERLATAKHLMALYDEQNPDYKLADLSNVLESEYDPPGYGQDGFGVLEAEIDAVIVAMDHGVNLTFRENEAEKYKTALYFLDSYAEPEARALTEFLDWALPQYARVSGVETYDLRNALQILDGGEYERGNMFAALHAHVSRLVSAEMKVRVAEVSGYHDTLPQYVTGIIRVGVDKAQQVYEAGLTSDDDAQLQILDTSDSYVALSVNMLLPRLPHMTEDMSRALIEGVSDFALKILHETQRSAGLE